jgi:tetratricopeptide (TPR) repeat protein
VCTNQLNKEQDGIMSDTLQLFSMRSLCFMHKNEYQKALEDLNQVMNYSPQDLNHLEWKGGRKSRFFKRRDCLIQLNRVEEGLQVYSQILFVNEDWRVYLKRAQVYVEQKEWEKSVKDYEVVLRKNGQCQEAWIGLADSFLHLDNYEEARKCYQVSVCEDSFCLEIGG